MQGRPQERAADVHSLRRGAPPHDHRLRTLARSIAVRGAWLYCIRAGADRGMNIKVMGGVSGNKI